MAKYKKEIHINIYGGLAMKRVIQIVFVIAVFLFSSTSVLAGSGDEIDLTPPTPEMTKVHWDAFGKNLVRALASEHEGLKLGAMRLVIQYANRIDVDAAKFDLMRLYRDHKDDRVRRMAVVALGRIENGWAMGFFQRAQHFEQSESVLNTMRHVLAEYEAGRQNA